MKTNKNIKLLICCLLCVAIGFSFVGCNFGVASTKPSMATEAVEDSTEEEASKAATTAASSTSSTTSTTAKATTTTTTTTESTTIGELELKKENKPKITIESTAATTKKSKKKAKKKTTTKAQQTGYVKITISCFEILNNKDSVQEGYSAFIPGNGYLIKDYKLDVKSAQTVYVALKNACNAKGVSVGEDVTQYGIYIYSIGSLDENVFGSKKGGWTYYVNGKMPNKSVDSYNLKAGDNIEFKYTKVS